MSTPLVFYYALRSPYAWLAQRLLLAHVPTEARQAIEYVPFWEPRSQTLQALHARRASFLFRPMSRERHLYILGDVKQHANRLGYPLRWPVDGAQPDWELPHLACLTACEHGFPAQHLPARLMAARWEQGLDICTPAVLEEVCRQAGLPAGLCVNPDPEGSPHGAALAALERGYRQGAFGVPFFVVGREKFWGVDRLPFALRAAGLPWRGLADAWLVGEAVR